MRFVISMVVAKFVFQTVSVAFWGYGHYLSTDRCAVLGTVSLAVVLFTALALLMGLLATVALAKLCGDDVNTRFYKSCSAAFGNSFIIELVAVGWFGPWNSESRCPFDFNIGVAVSSLLASDVVFSLIVQVLEMRMSKRLERQGNGKSLKGLNGLYGAR